MNKKFDALLKEVQTLSQANATNIKNGVRMQFGDKSEVDIVMSGDNSLPGLHLDEADIYKLYATVKMAHNEGFKTVHVHSLSDKVYNS